MLCVSTRVRVGQKWKWRKWQRQLELKRKRVDSLPFNCQKIRGCPTLRDSIQSEAHCLIVCIHVVNVVLKCHQVETVNWPAFVSTLFAVWSLLIVIGSDDKIKRKTSNSNLNISLNLTSLHSPLEIHLQTDTHLLLFYFLIEIYNRS